MASSGLKNFYRQKKKGGVAKPSSKRTIAGKSPAVALSLADHVPSPSYGSDAEHDKATLDTGIGEEEDEKLRQFDMDMRYGPCIGLTRTDRWERAAAMGLNPPVEVEAILSKSSAAAAGCLWSGRV